MSKTSSVFARVEPDIKEQAEQVLNELGIPMSNAIGLFLKQVVLNPSRFIRPTKQIIHADVIKIRQFDQDGGGNIIGSCFIFGVARLRHSQHFRYLPLGQVIIFPQLSNPSIQAYHLACIMANPFWVIDF